MGTISLELATFGTLFIAACSYYSYKAGMDKGIEAGADGCLSLLAKEGIVEFDVDENGEECIYPVQYEE